MVVYIKILFQSWKHKSNNLMLVNFHILCTYSLPNIFHQAGVILTVECSTRKMIPLLVMQLSNHSRVHSISFVWRKMKLVHRTGNTNLGVHLIRSSSIGPFASGSPRHVCRRHYCLCPRYMVSIEVFWTSMYTSK